MTFCKVETTAVLWDTQMEGGITKSSKISHIRNWNWGGPEQAGITASFSRWIGIIFNIHDSICIKVLILLSKSYWLSFLMMASLSKGSRGRGVNDKPLSLIGVGRWKVEGGRVFRSQQSQQEILESQPLNIRPLHYAINWSTEVIWSAWIGFKTFRREREYKKSFLSAVELLKQSLCSSSLTCITDLTTSSCSVTAKMINLLLLDSPILSRALYWVMLQFIGRPCVNTQQQPDTPRLPLWLTCEHV